MKTNENKIMEYLEAMERQPLLLDLARAYLDLPEDLREEGFNKAMEYLTKCKAETNHE